MFDKKLYNELKEKTSKQEEIINEQDKIIKELYDRLRKLEGRFDEFWNETHPRTF